MVLHTFYAVHSTSYAGLSVLLTLTTLRNRKNAMQSLGYASGVLTEV